MTETITLHSGRRLTVEQLGDPKGKPVFLLHGTPGSRLGPRPRAAVLYRLGVRLITFDRPGYGKSDRLQNRRVADAAEDVAAIADAYRIERFAVIGRSGGGPHALACAALLPERTTRVASLVALAPPDATELSWFRGMARSNVVEFIAAVSGQSHVARRLAESAERIRADPTTLVSNLQVELTERDRHILANSGIRTMLVDNYSEAFRVSACGWIDDIMALCSPWGFDLAGISAPALLWHGKDDSFSPVSHVEWLARRIDGAIVVIQSGAAHFGALMVLPDILQWCISNSPII